MNREGEREGGREGGSEGGRQIERGGKKDRARSVTQEGGREEGREREIDSQPVKIERAIPAAATPQQTTPPQTISTPHAHSRTPLPQQPSGPNCYSVRSLAHSLRAPRHRHRRRQLPCPRQTWRRRGLHARAWSRGLNSQRPPALARTHMHVTRAARHEQRARRGRGWREEMKD